MSGVNERCGSYEEMYESQYKRVFHYIRRNINNDEMSVEDLTQDVFLVAYQQWETVVRDHPNIPGYLTVIAQNKIKKWYEKQSRFYLDDPDTVALEAQKRKHAAGVDPYEMVEIYSSAEQVISSRNLHILRNYYEYDYKASELSQQLGVTESCFKIRVARMKEKLRKSIKLYLFLAVCLMGNGIFGL